MLSLLLLLLSVAAAQKTWVRDFGAASLFRTDGFGVPMVLGGDNLTDIWTAVGYAQGLDRFFQLFLRFTAANGRLSELFEASEANLEADIEILKSSYSDAQVLAEFASLDVETQATFRGYARGILMAVDEQMQMPKLPYEFLSLNITAERSVFSLTSILHFSIFTMRRLAAGWDPVFQLDNLKLMAALKAKWGESAAEAVFHDLVTTVDTFPLSTVVVNISAPVHGGEASNQKTISTLWSRQNCRSPPGYSTTHDRRLTMSRSVEKHLHDMGAVNVDGSWAAVSRSDNGKSYTEFGPQDDNNFPTTFYEVYVDSQLFSAHWFTEPGMPMNQLYGVVGNFSFGRNRGYAFANDYLTEPASQAELQRTVTISLRNGTTVSLPIYQSKSGGFVLENPGGGADVLTLRTAFVGQEMAGLNMLSKLVLCKSLDEMIKTLLVRSQQSVTIHSHLEVSDANSVGAVLNGLITSLENGHLFDRRFPLAWNASGLPAYVIELPRYQLNEKKAYFSWNTPFDDKVPWTSSYPYGGEWRSEWIGAFLANFSASNPLTAAALQDMPTHMNRGNALELGGDGPTDRFAQHMWPSLRPLLSDAKYASIRELLDGFQGYAFDDIHGHNLREDFVLANSWLYALIEAVFTPVLNRDSVGFEIPEPPKAPLVPILPVHPSRRFASIVILLLNATQKPLLSFNWTDPASVATLTLDGVLTRLGARPWGVGARPNASMNGLANAFDSSVRQLPDAQLPSINGAVEISICGATFFASSIPLGESGLVTMGADGEPVFSQHSVDQFELYQSYEEKKFPFVFNVTQQCEEETRGKIRNIIIIVTGAVVGAVVVFLIASCIYCRLYRRKPLAKYVQVGSEEA